jgi:hypothetical protein
VGIPPPGAGPLTAAQKLDVYRVEQRLKYLGFPAMGYGNPTQTSNNTIQDFSVDGQWENQEAYAAWLFNRVVNYNGTNFGTSTASTTTQLVNHGKKATFNRSTYNTQLRVNATGYAIANSATDPTFTYLNAYNAPHWMNIGAQIPTGWVNKQNGVENTQATNIERYGTSWMRDLMVAASKYAPDSLRGNPVTNAQGQVSYSIRNTFWFNGAVDANHGYTPWEHATHDLGMALDLGISQYVSKKKGAHSNGHDGNQYTAHEAPVVQAQGGTWSIAQAVAQKQQSGLPHTFDPMLGINYQDKAIGDFLSLYSVTRDDGGAATPVAGSRGSLITRIVNGGADKQKVLTALFGDGTKNGSLISKSVFGKASGNSYPNMKAIFTNLGINTGFDDVSHFHVYLRPPKVQTIINAQLLQASQGDLSGEVAGNPDSSLGDAVATMLNQVRMPDGEEESMFFTLDVPYNPPSDVLVLMAQATAASITPPVPDIKNQIKPLVGTTITFCLDVDNISTDGKPQPGREFNGVSANNLVSPFSTESVSKKLDKRLGLKKGDVVTVTILEQPRHGKLYAAPGAKDIWGYISEPGYVGHDRVVFSVEANGKKLKVVLNMRVEFVLDDDSERCKREKFELINKLDSFDPQGVAPSFGGLDTWQEQSSLNTIISAISNASLSFADLPGGAVGETTGTRITLDTNAAGYGWYVNPDPASYADFLPTANPDVWMAKAGSAAAGKMDMLSVLLHEYGHALGLDHSANPNDFMAPNLQPGERRLPSSAELAQLSQLATQLASTNNPAAPDNPTSPALPVGTALSALLIGRLRRTGYGSWTPVIDSIQIPAPQFERAVTLCNLSVRLK